MVEEKQLEYYFKGDIGIKKCEQGFVVVKSSFGLQTIRAFSTAEGLIEWLSRELGTGPIVWAWTIPIWMEMVGVDEKDLLPMPDASVNPTGYREAQEYNATWLITRFADKAIKAMQPQLPPEPKPKKEKKVKEKGPKQFARGIEALEFEEALPEEEKPKGEVKGE